MEETKTITLPEVVFDSYIDTITKAAKHIDRLQKENEELKMKLSQVEENVNSYELKKTANIEL